MDWFIKKNKILPLDQIIQSLASSATRLNPGTKLMGNICS